jgi:hypothetical protein
LLALNHVVERVVLIDLAVAGRLGRRDDDGEQGHQGQADGERRRGGGHPARVASGVGRGEPADRPRQPARQPAEERDARRHDERPEREHRQEAQAAAGRDLHEAGLPADVPQAGERGQDPRTGAYDSRGDAQPASPGPGRLLVLAAERGDRGDAGRRPGGYHGRRDRDHQAGGHRDGHGRRRQDHRSRRHADAEPREQPLQSPAETEPGQDAGGRRDQADDRRFQQGAPEHLAATGPDAAQQGQFPATLGDQDGECVVDDDARDDERDQREHQDGRGELLGEVHGRVGLRRGELATGLHLIARHPGQRRDRGGQRGLRRARRGTRDDLVVAWSAGDGKPGGRLEGGHRGVAELVVNAEVDGSDQAEGTDPPRVVDDLHRLAEPEVLVGGGGRVHGGLAWAAG